MPDYTVARIDEMEGAYGGAFKRVRATLGVTSFGMQVIDLPPDYERYPEHDHNHDSQEEVFLALRGSGEIDVDGERVPLDRETFVRVGPAAKRKIYAGPDGLRVLCLGGVPGGTYTPHPLSELGGPDRL